MKKSAVTFAFVLLAAVIYAQNCEVLAENLKGKYEGDCKKGKAHGHGKAEGKDTYEGDFKAGLPDGNGTYTWSNGSLFKGKWSKGLREGKGVMTFKTSSGQDSVIEGYWKKDLYAGKSEYPYNVVGKTKSVSEVEVQYTADAFNKISIGITNTTGGSKTITGESMPQMDISDIQIIKGAYNRVLDNNTHYKKKEKIFLDIQFPFHVKLIITGGGNTEEVEIEFTEKGSYEVDIRINQ